MKGVNGVTGDADQLKQWMDAKIAYLNESTPVGHTSKQTAEKHQVIWQFSREYKLSK